MLLYLMFHIPLIKSQIHRLVMLTQPISCKGLKLLSKMICNISRGAISIQCLIFLWKPSYLSLSMNVQTILASSQKQLRMQMVRYFLAWIQILLNKSSKSLQIQNAWICPMKFLRDYGIKEKWIIKYMQMITGQLIRGQFLQMIEHDTQI